MEPGQLGEWGSPDWQRYLPLHPCGGVLLRFGEQALLHHLVLEDWSIGSISMFKHARTTRRESRRRRRRRARMMPVSTTPALNCPIDAAALRQFFVDYWIATHKQLKAARAEVRSPPRFSGYRSSAALLRAWYMQATGNDIDARPTLHMLGVLHAGLAGRLSAEQHTILGLPSRTPEETIAAIEAIRAEMSRAGSWLAERYAFAYPHELEDIVRRVWHEHKQAVARR